MRPRHHVEICFIISVLLLNVGCFAQISEEKEESKLKVRRIRKESPDFKPSSRIAIFTGFETNANLTPTRKGDIFEELLYSFDFIKPLTNTIKVSLDYDLDVLNYHEFTDISSVVNHFRVGLQTKISPLKIGGGYDLGITYYPRNDIDFLFHRGFVYVRHDILKDLYQSLRFEAGVKDYTDKKTVGESLNAPRTNERFDRRWAWEYLTGARLVNKLNTGLKVRYLINDSNAIYVDFYDYRAYEGTLFADYQLLDNLYLLSNFTYLKKRYDNRTVTLRDYEQRDSLYIGDVGLLYKLDKYNSLSLHYTYRENVTNDSLSEYSASVVSLGWQYSF